jgi:hypothetical protein
MVEISKREAVIELVNRLFIFTDDQAWDKLLGEVFADEVFFDMSSAGGASPGRMKSSEICRMWKEGFVGIDSIHHQAGNYIVSIVDGVSAEVFCYATAMHFKKNATKGNVREFVGSYNLMAVFTDVGWRISGFRYNLKYVAGNSSLE